MILGERRKTGNRRGGRGRGRRERRRRKVENEEKMTKRKD